MSFNKNKHALEEQLTEEEKERLPIPVDLRVCNDARKDALFKGPKRKHTKVLYFFYKLSALIHDYIVNSIGEEQVADITNQLLPNEAYKAYLKTIEKLNTHLVDLEEKKSPNNKTSGFF